MEHCLLTFLRAENHLGVLNGKFENHILQEKMLLETFSSNTLAV
jgi:hypothetical protein